MVEYERIKDRIAKMRSGICSFRPRKFLVVGWDVLINVCHCDGEWEMDSEVSSTSSKYFLYIDIS